MALAPVPAPVTGIPAYDPTAIIGSLPQVNDSVATQVENLASKDSALNKMAATEGLKAANRRGLLNSSMAVGASQDAVLKNVMPIAQQDAQQSFLKNQANRAFELGLVTQNDVQNWTSGENTAQREWQTAEGIAGRSWQTGERIGTQEFESEEAKEDRAWRTGERVGAQGWQTAENIAQRKFLTSEATLDRDLEKLLQSNQIDSNELMQYRQIASTEGLAKMADKLSRDLQEKDIQFRMKEGNLDRASAEKMQAAEIAYNKWEGGQVRALQEKIANMNVASADKANAGQLLVQMEGLYQANYQSIMSNPDLDAKGRETLLKGAQTLRNTYLNLVEQIIVKNLKWAGETAVTGGTNPK